VKSWDEFKPNFADFRRSTTIAPRIARMTYLESWGMHGPVTAAIREGNTFVWKAYNRSLRSSNRIVAPDVIGIKVD